MSLQATITQDMKAAMKAREKMRLSTLRMLLSDLKNMRIQLQRDLTEAEEVSFLTTQAKQRQESIEAYDEAGREELAAREREELVVIKAYLPQQLTEDEAKALVIAAIAEVGATSKKEFGKVMRVVMPKLKGRFPGKGVKPLVESQLS